MTQSKSEYGGYPAPRQRKYNKKFQKNQPFELI